MRLFHWPVCLSLAIHTVSFAQTTAIQTTDPSRGATLPPTSAALVDEATAPVVNPAGLAYLNNICSAVSCWPRFQLFYLHDQSWAPGDLNRTADAIHLGISFFQVLAAGFGLDWVRGSTVPSYRKTHWSLALGGQELSLGANFNVFSSSSALSLDGLTSFDVGLSSRPSKYFSLAAALRNADKPARGIYVFDREYDLALALRPFGEKVTLAADYLFAQTPGIGGGRFSYLLQTEPFRGVVLGLGFSHVLKGTGDALFQASATINTSYLGVTYAAGGTNPGFGNVIAVRVSREKYPAVPIGHQKVAIVDLGAHLSSGGGISLFGRPEDPYLRFARFLDQAERDQDLKGIILKIDLLPGTGLGKVQELREALFRLRKAGKKVVAFILMAEDSEYFLATAADQIFVAPQAVLLVNGLAASTIFLGEAMDKLGVHWDVARVGDYKNAPDQLTRSQMSEAQKETINAYLDVDTQLFETAVTEARSISVEQFRLALRDGLLTPARAKQFGLVDDILAQEELEKRVRQQMPGSHYERHYQPRDLREATWGTRRRIAIVPVIGNIETGKTRQDPFGIAPIAGSDTVVRLLRSASEDSSVAAIVLRVDSGGGDGLASDLMYRAVLEAKKTKPVVATMGDVAASGGYYAAMGADEVFAEPSTITGSIGVFLLKPVFGSLASKLGIHHEMLKRGDLAGIFSLFEPWTDDERKAAQRWVDSFYDDFIGEVSASRGIPKEDVDKIARGRVWAGADAKTRGLVDTLGSLEEAIGAARRRAGVADSEELELDIMGESTGLVGSILQDSDVRTALLGPETPSAGALKTIAQQLGITSSTVLEPGIKAMMPFALSVR